MLSLPTRASIHFANRMDDYKLAITQFPTQQTICDLFLVLFFYFFALWLEHFTHWISVAEAKWCICSHKNERQIEWIEAVEMCHIY